MKISVIVPVYNGEKYIGKCLENLINQTLDDIEIILVNDSSKDKTYDIIKKYVTKYKNIKLINKKNNEGVGAARNDGIKIASGEYIGFVDSDDIVDTNMYSDMYNLAKNNNSDVVMCSYIRKHKNNSFEVRANINESIANYDRNIIVNKIIPTFVENIEYGYYYVWNKIYKKEFLNKNNILFKENLDFGEDWFFNLEVFDNVQKFSYINYPYYTYITSNNNNSLSKNVSINRIKGYLKGREKSYYFINKYNLERKNIDLRFLEEIYTYVNSIIISENSYKFKKNIIKSISEEHQFKECIYCINEMPKFIKVSLNLLKCKRIDLLIILIYLHNKIKR